MFRHFLLRVRFCFGICGLLFFLGGCAGTPPCLRASINVSYHYFTTCAGIATQPTGQLVWQVEQQAQSELDTHSSLREQSHKQGVFVDSMSLVWARKSCDTDKTPIQVTGLERIVFSPDTGDTGSVQFLLVCEQGGGAAPLQKDILLSCRRGQQKGVVCVLQLKRSQ